MKNLPVQGGEVEDSGLLQIPLFLISPLFFLSLLGRLFSLYICLYVSVFIFFFIQVPLRFSSCVVLQFPLFVRWFSRFSSVFLPPSRLSFPLFACVPLCLCLCFSFPFCSLLSCATPCVCSLVLCDTTKRLMSSPKCKSVEVINNPAKPGSNHKEVNCINYK